MYFENTTFANDNEFKEHMKVEGAVSEDVFDYLFDVDLENSYQKKNIFLNYSRNGTKSIFNQMKILMIIQIMMVWKI